MTDANFAADRAEHMRRLTIRPGVEIVYEDHWFGAPWDGPPETVLMLHGIGERSQTWSRFVPHLAGRYRVVRPNLPGMGISAMPAEYDWGPAALARDLHLMIGQLGIGPVHLVGAKYGGSIAMRLAMDFPDQVRTLAVFGSPVKRVQRADHGGRSAAEEMQRMGRTAWLAKTMRMRLGSGVSENQIAWWSVMQNSGDARASVAAATAISQMDMEADLPRILAPTLMVSTSRSGLHSEDAVLRYVQAMRDARAVILDGDSYHIAAAEPDLCARHLLNFMDEAK